MARQRKGKVRDTIARLESRLLEAEETLDAIRSGSVDALVVHTPRGEQLFTLKGADQSYRTMVESMSEGAVTLRQNIISYCNQYFAEIVQAPLEQVIGSSILELIPAREFQSLIRKIDKGKLERASFETCLQPRSGTEFPVQISASRLLTEGRWAVCLIVMDIRARKEAERVRQETSRRIVSAQEQERQRVARDLHDGVTQLLSSAKYRLGSLVAARDFRQVRETLPRIMTLVEKALAEVREISQNLRPSELDDLGLGPALQTLSEDFQARSGIKVRFQRPEHLPRFPGEINMALYRIAQEGLNNVEKHSRASRADLSLGCVDDCASVTIKDNGKGFRPTQSLEGKTGWGLQNMKERAALLNGSFEIRSNPGQGTQLSALLPLAAHKEPHGLSAQNQSSAGG